MRFLSAIRRRAYHAKRDAQLPAVHCEQSFRLRRCSKGAKYESEKADALPLARLRRLSVARQRRYKALRQRLDARRERRRGARVQRELPGGWRTAGLGSASSDAANAGTCSRFANGYEGQGHSDLKRHRRREEFRICSSKTRRRWRDGKQVRTPDFALPRPRLGSQGQLKPAL